MLIDYFDSIASRIKLRHELRKAAIIRKRRFPNGVFIDFTIHANLYFVTNLSKK